MLLKTQGRIRTPRFVLILWPFAMLVFGAARILRFLRLSNLLTQLGETGNFECSKDMLSLTTSHTSHHIFVALRIKPTFFFLYLPSIASHFFNWGIPLKEFCDHLRHGIDYSSMCLTISDQNPPSALLQFFKSCTFEEKTSTLSRKIMLSSPGNQEDVGNINRAIFVSIDSQQFKHIVRHLRSIDKVYVTLSNKQVIFQSADIKIVLNTEYRECIIGGVEAGGEVRFTIQLCPATFFIDLTSLVDRVWLHMTTTSVSVIYAPVDFNVEFEIYFL